VDVNDDAAIATFLDKIGRFGLLAFAARDRGSARFVGPLRTMDFETVPDALGLRFWGALKAVRRLSGSQTDDAHSGRSAAHRLV
jgi:hypothetical protein